jgi:hypothetical protein
MEDPAGHLLLSADLSHASAGRWSLRHAKGEPQYGIGGLNAFDAATGNLLRQGKQVATAGKQGHTGAPLVWSTAGYGVLADAEPAPYPVHLVSPFGRLSVPKVRAFVDFAMPRLRARFASLAKEVEMAPKKAIQPRRGRMSAG